MRRRENKRWKIQKGAVLAFYGLTISPFSICTIMREQNERLLEDRRSIRWQSIDAHDNRQNSYGIQLTKVEKNNRIVPRSLCGRRTGVESSDNAFKGPAGVIRVWRRLVSNSELATHAKDHEIRSS
jgi:hypothetical protein